MADKVQKIREEIEKRYEYWRKKEFSHGTESEIRMSECQHLLLMIDSLQEDPVSEDLEEAAKNHAVERYRVTRDRELAEKCKWSFKAGAKWQEKEDQSTIELAEDHAILAGMEKMKEQMMKNIWKSADGDDLPIFDREVIALLNSGKVVFAHRPYKGKYIGKSLTTGNIETFENKTYDKGGWNQPNVKWWLDCEWPNKKE